MTTQERRTVKLSEAAELPIWTDDALSRLLGARDGYIHSLLTVRAMIRRFDSTYTGRFDPRHVRKIAQRDAITKPLREIADAIEADMRRCSDAYTREYARAHPAGRAALPPQTQATESTVRPGAPVGGAR